METLMVIPLAIIGMALGVLLGVVFAKYKLDKEKKKELEELNKIATGKMKNEYIAKDGKKYEARTFIMRDDKNKEFKVDVLGNKLKKPVSGASEPELKLISGNHNEPENSTLTPVSSSGSDNEEEKKEPEAITVVTPMPPYPDRPEIKSKNHGKEKKPKKKADRNLRRK